MSETLLVTGGAGFIGQAVVNAALEAGWRVRVLDSMREDVHARTHRPEAEYDGDIEFLRGDVTQADDAERALRGVSAVSHQAAKVGLGVDFDDASDYVRSNDLGTVVLLNQMAKQQIRNLVLASSMVVYGEGAYRSATTGELVAAPPRTEQDLAAGRFEPIGPDGQPLESVLVSEDAALDPRNVYAATKAQQEYLAKAWAIQFGGRAAFLRYHNVYGPQMPQNTPYAGVASLFRSRLEQGLAPLVFEDGGQRRDFVHVKDVAAANVAALDWVQGQAATTTRAFNVGSGQVHTIGEMAALLADEAKGPAPIITGEFRLGDVRHVTADSTRMRQELHVPFAVPFEEGIREFAHAPLREAVR